VRSFGWFFYNFICGDANKLVQAGHAIDPESVSKPSTILTRAGSTVPSSRSAPTAAPRVCRPRRTRAYALFSRTLTPRSQMVKRLTTGTGRETHSDSDKRS